MAEWDWGASAETTVEESQKPGCRPHDPSFSFLFSGKIRRGRNKRRTEESRERVIGASDFDPFL